MRGARGSITRHHVQLRQHGLFNAAVDVEISEANSDDLFHSSVCPFFSVYYLKSSTNSLPVAPEGGLVPI